MSSPVRETVLAWVKTRLGTLAGYTVGRHGIDAVEDDLPFLMLQDGGQSPVDPSQSENDEQAWELDVLIVAIVGGATGDEVGAALSTAIADIYNALMLQSAWASPVRNVRPGEVGAIDLADPLLAEKAEYVVGTASGFTILFATACEDAFAASN